MEVTRRNLTGLPSFNAGLYRHALAALTIIRS
jgi:hypothetical protein